MEFEFDQKVSSRDFILLLNQDWKKALKGHNDIVFNLEKLEWITSEALTFVIALVNCLKNRRSLKTRGVNIKLILPNPGNLLFADIDFKNKDKRSKRLASLTDIWKIDFICGMVIGSDIIVPSDFHRQINKVRSRYKYIDSSWYKIIPFHKLQIGIYKDIDNIREHLDDKLKEVYKLEEDTLGILNKFNSKMSFENQTLSHLITTELFLNSIFHSRAKESYFSITLNSEFRIEVEKEKFLNQGYSECSLPQK